MIKAEDGPTTGRKSYHGPHPGGREEPVPLEPQISGIAGRANDMPRTGFDRRADAVHRAQTVIREVRDKHG